MAVNSHENLARKIIERTTGLNPKDKAVVNFFSALLPVQPIEDIYYPGNGMDFMLDRFFNARQRYYLDKQPRRDDVVSGDFRITPNILDGTFSSVFIQDTHATKQGISEILRTVKNGGLVILSNWSCGIEPKDSMPNADIARLPFLKPASIIKDPGFTILLKHER